MPRARLRPRHFLPLVGFVVPTVAIRHGVSIPRSSIAGPNDLTVGFASAVAGACVIRWLGLRSLVREGRRSDEA